MGCALNLCRHSCSIRLAVDSLWECDKCRHLGAFAGPSDSPLVWAKGRSAGLAIDHRQALAFGELSLRAAPACALPRIRATSSLATGQLTPSRSAWPLERRSGHLMRPTTDSCFHPPEPTSSSAPAARLAPIACRSAASTDARLWRDQGPAGCGRETSRGMKAGPRIGPAAEVGVYPAFSGNQGLRAARLRRRMAAAAPSLAAGEKRVS